MLMDIKIVSMPYLIISPTPEANCNSSLCMLVVQFLVYQATYWGSWSPVKVGGPILGLDI